ncbi:MSCRAMM family protein [Neorhodopirellula pilleata]|uniref:Serine-aspartate repeat-containing protein D n=1 Tax=Neorhodopirellula pilleata TaxID=2714738 RepID=A0A5C6AWR6_9BACT|nr:SdrD B-like domain-containing protein [Neorhodopirellula pilleata]TWU03911.1 Serine-aspartate repeat-containing protein D precursor [Neorhodopirellula pilleata]
MPNSASRFPRRRRRLLLERFENRRVLAGLGVDIEFSVPGVGEITGDVLRGETVVVDVKVQDVREAAQTPAGVIALPLRYQWNSNELNAVRPLDNLPSPLPLDDALVTGDFPLQRLVQPIEQSANGSRVLPRVQGAALPNQTIGQALGTTQSDTFSTLQFIAEANTNEADFTVTLAGSMSFADAAVLDGVIPLDRTVAVEGIPLAVRASIGIVGGSLSGIKFNDVNENGIRDAGEEVAGVTIQLDTNGDDVVDLETVTANDGTYRFDDLPKGTYTITEVAPDGTEVFLPVSGEYTVTLDQANQNPTGLDFGNNVLPPVTSDVSGTKFDDLNGNGVRDAGEPGLAGITILLDRGNDNSPERMTVTDADGNFRFTGVTAGNYSVSEMLPARTVRTTPETPFVIDVTPPDAVTGLLFGNFGLTNLGGLTFEDLDGDGVQDADEVPLPNVTVELDLDDDGTVDFTTQSGNDGRYQFTDVGPGTHRVIEIVPNGFMATTPVSIPVENRSGTDRNDLNFGLRTPPPIQGSINGFVYTDNDFDGEFDSNEFGLPGIVVELFRGGEMIRTTQTQADGSYRFADLPAGTYRIVQTQPDRFADASISRGTVLPSGETRGATVGLNTFEGLVLGDNETAIDYNFGEILTAVSKRMFTASANLRGELSSSISPTEFRVKGTASNDRITIENLNASGVRITINDQAPVTFTPGQASLILIDGLGGDDRVDFLGSDASESFSATPSRITVKTTSQSIGVFGVEDIRVAGGGGNDEAIIRDTDQSDQLNATGSVVALLAENGSRIGLMNVPRVQAISAIDTASDTTNIDTIDFVLELAGDWTASP